MPNSARFRALCISLSLASISAIASAQSLLVVNQGDSDVSIVNPQSAQQVDTIAENTPGVHAHEITTSLDGKTAYLPIYGSTGVGKPGIDGHEMLVLDLPSRKIIAHLDFGHGVRPHLPVLDPTSGLLYVTTELDKSVTIIDPKDPLHLKIVGSVPTGQEQSHMFVLSHDGKRGYTANVGPGTVSVLDLKARKTVTIIPISKNTQRISICNDDKWVFTSDQTTPRLAVIDTATNKLKQWIDMPGSGYGSASTKDGKFLLICIPSTRELAVIDLATLTVVHHIPVPAIPQEVIVRPDGKVAYVSCNQSAQVAAIDISQWKVQSLINAGKLADGLAWAK
jgi:DNA-binding beta-propeller fold protein YncE